MSAARTSFSMRSVRIAGRLSLAAVVLVGVIGFVASQIWDPSAVRGSFDVGGRSLYLECVGEGSPTIVMEAGSGGDHTVVVGCRSPGCAAGNRTCTYDRANTGSSSQVSGNRTFGDVAADLHGLLDAAKIAPPYILVGHSLGGISMRLFASTYADEVEALILVDATPTTFVADACAVVDANQCDTFRSDFEAANNGGIDIAGSAAEISAAGPLRPMPVIVLAASDHGHDGFPTDLRQRFEAMWLERQSEVADSVDGGRLQAVASGHNVQAEQPDIVILAISTVAAELAAMRP